MKHTENLQNNTFKIIVIEPRFTGKSMFINELDLMTMVNVM